jgi:hypothetical protein
MTTNSVKSNYSTSYSLSTYFFVSFSDHQTIARNSFQISEVTWNYLRVYVITGVHVLLTCLVRELTAVHTLALEHLIGTVFFSRQRTRTYCTKSATIARSVSGLCSSLHLCSVSRQLVDTNSFKQSEENLTEARNRFQFFNVLPHIARNTQRARTYTEFRAFHNTIFSFLVNFWDVTLKSQMLHPSKSLVKQTCFGRTTIFMPEDNLNKIVNNYCNRDVLDRNPRT